MTIIIVIINHSLTSAGGEKSAGSTASPTDAHPVYACMVYVYVCVFSENTQLVHQTRGKKAKEKIPIWTTGQTKRVAVVRLVDHHLDSERHRFSESNKQGMYPVWGGKRVGEAVVVEDDLWLSE